MDQLLSRHKARKNLLRCPLYVSQVKAGFPSPADDFIETRLSLDEALISHPVATFFLRVDGDSMQDAGILHGDMLIVDRAVKAEDNHIVVAVLDGDFTVKRLRKSQGRVYLIPANGEYQPIEVTEEMECAVWGVVRYAIHEV